MLKNYSVASVVKYRSVFYGLLEKAFDNNLIQFNPFARVKSPTQVTKKFKKLDDVENDIINPFTLDEIIIILNNTTGNLYYFIYIMFFTGIRPGELISLTWNDVDFQKRRIGVDKTIFQGKIGDVKTQSSVRYVDILPSLYEKLLKYKDSSNQMYLITNNRKKPFYSHCILNVRFKALLNKLGIPERSIYNLRHTFASHMVSLGADILWVSKMLGHKDVSVTLKVYAKHIKENDKKRIQKINNLGIILDIN